MTTNEWIEKDLEEKEELKIILGRFVFFLHEKFTKGLPFTPSVRWAEEVADEVVELWEETIA